MLRRCLGAPTLVRLNDLPRLIKAQTTQHQVLDELQEKDGIFLLTRRILGDSAPVLVVLRGVYHTKSGRTKKLVLEALNGGRAVHAFASHTPVLI